MPILFHTSSDRRSFLKTAALGGAALVFAGCRTASPSRAESAGVHLALLSDTHVPGDRVNGHRGFNPWENLQRVVPAVVAARPDGVVVCGDVARLEGKEEDYREVQALLAPVAAVAPVYLGLGNHDDRANFRKVFAAPAGMRAPVNDKHVTVVELADLRVIVLDSLLYPNKVAGHLGRAQRAWLAKYLPTLNDRPVVLFVHHTLGDGDGDLLDTENLLALARSQRHVKALFYGHSHVWALSRQDRLRLINLPAVGYNFSDGQPVGWVEARFDRVGVSLTLHALGGNRRDDGKTIVLEWL